MFIISLLYLFIYAVSNNLRVTTMKVLGLLIDIHINSYWDFPAKRQNKIIFT